MLQHIVPMLILTGARKREVLDARWEDFDLERRQWRIPTTKSGRPRHVPLSDGVLQMLTSLPHHEKGWIFANPKTGKPFVSVFISWNTARKLADTEVCPSESGHAVGCGQLGEYGAGWDVCADGVCSAYGFTGLVGHFDITLPQRSPSQRNC